MARFRSTTTGTRGGVATRVGVLGPVAVEHDGQPVHIAGTQRRRLLAFLVSRPGRAASIDSIIDVLWPDDPPPSAAKTVQSHVLRLRRSLVALGDVLVTVPNGYLLDLEPDAVDVVRFEQLVAAASREHGQGDPAAAREHLLEALALWRGPAYVDAAGAAFADAEAVRLDEMRRRAVEDLAQADLDAGAARAAVPELERLVAVEPGRERAWALLMRCLYVSGRQRDALRAFERARYALAEQFGLQPGPTLREVHEQVLRQAAELDVSASTAQPPAALRATTPLVGREPELAVLLEAWSTVRAGRGRVVVLRGAVGAGRTRLAAAIADVALGDGGTVEHAVGASVVESLADGTGQATGHVVDAIVDRCRRRPLLLVIDEAEWLPAAGIAVVDALGDLLEQLRLLLVLIVADDAAGPAVESLRRAEQAAGATAVHVGPLDDDALAGILAADGADGEAIAAAVAVADGNPAVARREAAAWMERLAGDRVQQATARSIAATTVADRAHATVFDEVLGLIAARAHRDALVSASWTGRQPYRALAPYGPEDADLFVGRERLVAELAARVLDRRMVAVVGASGSGKSSVVRAGLVPLVRSGRLPGTGPWRANVIVPGTDPFAALAAVDGIDEPGNQLLVVDQFEEVATTGVGEPFGSRLLELTADLALDVHVVVVVRADQFGALASSPQLIEAIEDAQVIVGAPTDDELRRIVTEPARRTGCSVEAMLADLVVADVAGEDGTLPLASAALAEVWERRTSDMLTADHYEAIGRLSAAVGRLGDRALELAGDDDGLREVVLRLVDVTEDGHWVRRRVATTELPSALAPAVDALVAARLAVRDGDVLDIVHEVVFRSWPRAVGWLEGARADLVLGRDLRTWARNWDEAGRSDDDLARGARRLVAGEWLARHPGADPTVAAFVDASERHADEEQGVLARRLAAEVRARRRLSRVLIAAGVLLVGALVAGTLAIVGQRQANDARQDALAAADAENEARRAAEEAEARAEDGQQAAERQRDLAVSARLLLESRRHSTTQPELSMLLAVEAARRSDSADTSVALHDILADRYPQIDDDPTDAAPPLSFAKFLPGPTVEGSGQSLGMSDDGHIVAVSGTAEDGSGVAVVFDAEEGEEIGRVTGARPSPPIDVSPDGGYVAVAGESVQVFDVAARAQHPLTSELAGYANQVTFDPFANRFALTGNEGSITVWDAVTRTQLAVPEIPVSSARLAGFAPDGTLAITQVAADAGPERGIEVQFWDIDKGAERSRVALVTPTRIPTRFTFAPDMRYVAGPADGALIIWDLATGEVLGGPDGRVADAVALAFLPPVASGTLAVARSGGRLQFQDVASGWVAPFEAAGAPDLVDLEVSMAGDTLAGISSRGTVVLWRQIVDGLPVQTVACCTEGLASVLGSRFVLTSSGPTYRMRDTSKADDPGIVVLEVSEDNARILAPIQASTDSTIVLANDASVGGLVTTITDLTSGVQRRLDLEISSLPSLSPDGRRLAMMGSGSPNGSPEVEVWDTASLTPIVEVPMFELGIDTLGFGGLQFTADGSAIDISTQRGIARLRVDDLSLVASELWNVARVPQGTDDLPGTNDIVGALQDGSLVRVDVMTGDEVAADSTHGAPEFADVEIAPNGLVGVWIDRLNGRARLFDVETLRPIGDAFWVAAQWTVFTSDSRYFADLLPDGSYRLRDVDPDAWQSTICAMAGRDLTEDEWRQYIGEDEPYRSTCER